MISYVLKRILIFLPTLFAISLIAFWLGKIAPGDPVEARFPPESNFQITGNTYQLLYEQMGLDKPMFYFAFSAVAYPDTLFKIPGRYHQKSIARLIAQYGNWENIQVYNTHLESLNSKIDQIPTTADQTKMIEIRRAATMLLEEHRDTRISSLLLSLNQSVFEKPDALILAELGTLSRSLTDSYEAIKSNSRKYKLFLPVLKWQGFDNQYHHWAAAFMKGDFGVSYRSRQAVADRIKTPIFWTLIINLIVITITYILAVPLGVFSAIKKDTLTDKFITTGLFILFSLPTFWIGTMLLVFFTNPEYGMNWFEGAGLGSLSSDAPFWARFNETARHLILPVFCLTYGSLAFMSRQMRGGMLNVLNQDYIRTAKAKGLPDRKVIWKHAFKNALFPLITIFARVLPATIAGSVVIELIFNIPGMGREVITAIYAKDWPVLYTILMLVAVLTMIGNLLADLLYAYVDPRIKFK